MLYKQFELHNVEEVEERPTGVHLYRFPKRFCDTSGMDGYMYGRYVSRTTPGCEIRFVTEGDRAMISLSAVDCDGYVQIYRGDFRYYSGFTNTFPIKRGEVTHIELLKSTRFEELDPSLKRKKGGFSPDVWRVMSDINFTMTFVDFEDYGYRVRPPHQDELPAKTLLCYGTSLTYGACATCQSISYPQMLGRLLNVNLLNKAMGGSCMNEPELADWFASIEVRFDAMLLENAVNMGRMYEEYEKRTVYLLDTVTRAKPEIPVFMLTCYPNADVSLPGCAYPVAKKDPYTDREVYQSDAIIRRIAAQYPQVHVIEGSEVMSDFTNLTCDLIHMSDYGQIEAAYNLSKAIRECWLPE